MTATVTAFPPPHFTASDRAELLRWSAAAAAVAGWSVWSEDAGGLVARADDGDEYASLIQDQSQDGCAYTVARHRGRWELTDARGALAGTFSTLRDALEAVCRTIRDDGAPLQRH